MRYRLPMPRDLPPAPPAPTRHQRADGAAELVFHATPRGPALARLYQQAPMRVLFPDPEPGEPPLAALVNCAGGLAGGDRIRLDVEVQAGAQALVTTPAAEKLYRSLGADTRIATTLRLAAGAQLEWLPQETILFQHARLQRSLTVQLAPDARLLAAEMLVLGRGAHGEKFRQGLLRDRWRIEGPDGLLWTDALELAGDFAPLMESPFGFAGAEAMATLLLAAPEAATLRDMLREAGAAATLPRPGLLLARWLGRATVVRRAVAAGLLALRPAAMGLPARLPRLWTT